MHYIMEDNNALHNGRSLTLPKRSFQSYLKQPLRSTRLVGEHVPLHVVQQLERAAAHRTRVGLHPGIVHLCPQQ